MKTDIQIAQEAKMEHIKDVAARAGIEENELEFYGKYLFETLIVEDSVFLLSLGIVVR